MNYITVEVDGYNQTFSVSAMELDDIINALIYRGANISEAIEINVEQEKKQRLTCERERVVSLIKILFDFRRKIKSEIDTI